MNNIEELKPCPFCGGKAHLLTSNGSFLVECSVCLTDFLNGPVGIGWYRSEKDAAAGWNDRPIERALIAQLEAAQKERDEAIVLNKHLDLSIRKGEVVNSSLRERAEKAEAQAESNALEIRKLGLQWSRAEKAEAALSAANEKHGWIKRSDQMPDPNQQRRVCVFTPSSAADLRYRLVPANLFKAVCSSSTHWHYVNDPVEGE
ncbi:Lar family restriction alleviation protein [Yersinia enterocolitica]|uniref:Lar family restriction alleviation protein n=1 Tax=Yersinia enterocolitica TaxID=630 RepID=UPI0005E2D33C|nr:Lar family restriction alleviation protein [Yersinia enterocolitica]CNE89936.1 restriction alleviation protein%2C Lar family [Yersinia enterocolitica]